MLANRKQEGPRKLTGRGVYTMALYSSPVLVIFTCLGDFYRGLGAFTCATMVLIVVWMRWDLREQAWFWITIAFMALWQIPLVLFIPWESNELRIILYPSMFLNFGIGYGSVRLVESLMKSANPPDET
jgi:hypothetical protein